MRTKIKVMSSERLRKLVRNKSNTMRSLRMAAYGELVRRRNRK